jgi:hypothetical protein
MLRFRTAARPQSVLRWTLLWFAASQAGLGVFLVRLCPEVRDPEYGPLHSRLHVRLAEMPERPLVLILGSSRSANLFRPSPPAAPSDPVIFNFATLSSGPLRQLQMLRRLLAEGVRPRMVIAELYPPFLNQRPGCAEEEFIRDRDLVVADGPLLTRYFSNPKPAYSKLAEAMLVPAFGYRANLMAQCSPFRADPKPGVPDDWSDPRLRGGEGFGWLAIPWQRLGPELFQRALAYYENFFRPRVADFRIRPVADRAVRDLLHTCAGCGARAVLVLLPEHSAMRACYPAAVGPQVDAYLADLVREESAVIIDARDWMADEDYLDGVHALAHVAGPFTERFRREVLLPLLTGQPVPAARYPAGRPAPSPSL